MGRSKPEKEKYANQQISLDAFTWFTANHVVVLFPFFFGSEKLTLRSRLLPMKERQHKEFLFSLGIQRLFQKENTGKQTIAAAHTSSQSSEENKQPNENKNINSEKTNAQFCLGSIFANLCCIVR